MKTLTNEQITNIKSTLLYNTVECIKNMLNNYIVLNTCTIDKNDEYYSTSYIYDENQNILYGVYGKQLANGFLYIKLVTVHNDSIVELNNISINSNVFTSSYISSIICNAVLDSEI